MNNCVTVTITKCIPHYMKLTSAIEGSRDEKCMKHGASQW